jgi:hypothetical protein
VAGAGCAGGFAVVGGGGAEVLQDRTTLIISNKTIRKLIRTDNFFIFSPPYGSFFKDYLSSIQVLNTVLDQVLNQSHLNPMLLP